MIPDKTKALVFNGINDLSMREYPIPALEPDQILIRVAYCGICATDYDNFAGLSSFSREGRLIFPLRWGHEWAGRVCAVGSAVTDVAVGDRVISEGKITCGKCPECRAGRAYNCIDRRTIGTVGNCWPGGMAEYTVMPARNVLKMGANVSFQQAAAIESASIAMNGLRDIDMKGKTLLILGSGPIGLSAIPIGRYFGAEKIIISARREAKLAIAKAMGADAVINTLEEDLYARVSELTGGTRADVVLETSGEASFVENAVRLTAINGAFSTISFYNRHITDMNFDDIVFNKVTLIGRCGSYNCCERLLELIDRGEIDLRAIITSVIDFYEDGPACMERYLAQKNSGSKMLVRIFGEEA